MRSATDTLREEILARAEGGGLLGSEDELCERLGVSRPTLRQAARLLEHEQLLTIKRGPGGGYFARRPDIDMVSHVAAIWLRCQNTSILDILDAAGPLIRETARRAAENPDRELRRELEDLLFEMTQESDPFDSRAFVLQEAVFNSLISKMGSNAPIELFQSILNDFGLTQTQLNVFGVEERKSEWRELQLEYGAAVINRDPDAAERIVRQRNKRMIEWLRADLEELSGNPLSRRLMFPHLEPVSG